MRPVPSSKHILSVVIFLAVAAVSAYLAWEDDRLSPEQISLAAAAAKRNQPDLMPFDSVYGEVNAAGRLGQLHTPVFLGLMDMVLIPTGFRDLSLPFRMMVAPMVFLYLCGMYALLWRQCRSSTIAAFVAILSMTIVHTLGHWSWGIGSLGSITPAGLVMAVSPLILLSYRQNAHRPQVVLTFAVIGLCANIHLISAVNLALVLLLVHLGRSRFSLRSILTAAGGFLFFLLGAMPYLMYFLALRVSIASLDPAGSQTSAETVIQALRISGQPLLYPEMLKSLLQWGLYASVLVLPAAIMLWRIERFHARDIDLWIWITAVGLFVALGLHGLSQWLGRVWGSTPPVIDFVQASCWVMPALYVLFAQAMTHLFRIVQRNRRYLQWACAVLLVAWMLPSDNLRLVRHGIYHLGSAFLEETDKPIRVQELQDRTRKNAELSALADWAREKTDRRAVFITGQETFRMQARRSLFVNREDVRHFYYLAPWELDDWTKQVVLQYQWLSDPLNAKTLTAGVNRLAAEKSYEGVPEWYVLLPRRTGTEDVGSLKEIPSQTWGQYWRVFRIPLRRRSPPAGR